MVRRGIAAAAFAALPAIVAAGPETSPWPGVSDTCYILAQNAPGDLDLFTAAPQCAPSDKDCLIVKLDGIRRRLVETDEAFKNCMKIFPAGPAYVCNKQRWSLGQQALDIETAAIQACSAFNGQPQPYYYCTKKYIYAKLLEAMSDNQRSALASCAYYLGNPAGVCWDHVAKPSMQSMVPALSTDGIAAAPNLAQWFLNHQNGDVDKYIRCQKLFGDELAFAPTCLDQYLKPLARQPAVCNLQCQVDSLTLAYANINAEQDGQLRACAQYFPAHPKGYCHDFLVPGADPDRHAAIDEMTSKCGGCSCCLEKTVKLLYDLNQNAAFRHCVEFFGGDGNPTPVCMRSAVALKVPGYAALAAACDPPATPAEHKTYCLSSKAMDAFRTLSAAAQQEILDLCDA